MDPLIITTNLRFTDGLYHSRQLILDIYLAILSKSQKEDGELSVRGTGPEKKTSLLDICP